MIFGNDSFYNQTLRRYIVTFGNMFNELVVQRLDATQTRVQTIAVPITYAPKEKFLARTTLDPNLNRPLAVQLPAMSFEITGMSYDGERRLSSTTQNVKLTTKQSGVLRNYVPVPWNIDFSLYIYIRNADDGAQILEQILPFFGPEWTNSVLVLPSMGIPYDIPTEITGVSMEDAYEGSFDGRRTIIYTVNFVMRGYFFGPIHSTGPRNKLIKKIKLDFMVPEGNTITDLVVADTGRSERIIITPGLLANGSPTSNSAASINYQLITANSNYGFAANVFSYGDGLKFNPTTGNDE
ncbi:MAG: hypothetical protein EBU08_15970 [Micrococcales bacterium]|nr:hypothetical protein [Micrococcales bacterium]